MPAGYFRYTLPRPDGSTLIFYADFDQLDPSQPLAVWMQGSGYHSLFPVRDGKTRHGPYSIINEVLGDGVQTLAVEKRGVPFGLIGKGAAEEAPQEYHEHATLEGRTSDVILVLSAFQRQERLPDRLLAIGHSEGADIAAKVAADYPPVTHLAFLAGGGPSQLFDFMTLIRKSENSPEEKEAQIAALWESWAQIQADPSSTGKMFRGHAFKRWASFVPQAPLQNLLRTDAKILMIHGSEDTSVPIESADLSAVELTLAGRRYEYLRLPGADHSLRTEAQKAANAAPFLPLGNILRRFFLGG